MNVMRATPLGAAALTVLLALTVTAPAGAQRPDTAVAIPARLTLLDAIRLGENGHVT